MIIRNIFKHTGVVLHHKWVVFKLSCKVGIIWRGLIHDLSKFTPSEFIPSVKYFAEGKGSPISKEKRERGYSEAWIHHKGRNRHHPEYWHDDTARLDKPIIPFKYMCEMICDQLSAGLVYEGKNWTKDHQLKYWTKQKETCPLNEKLVKMLDIVYSQVAQQGIDKTLTKKNLKEIYDECTK